MITAIEIEGFKAFAHREPLSRQDTLEGRAEAPRPCRIEFSPITLLFGANSAGKSSILHAIHYARELFLKGTTDVHQTESGGKALDLGGFYSLIHGHGLGGGYNRINLRFEFDLDMSLRDDINNNRGEHYDAETLSKALISPAGTGWIELMIEGDSFGGIDLHCCVGLGDSTIMTLNNKGVTSTNWKDILRLTSVSDGDAFGAHYLGSMAYLELVDQTTPMDAPDSNEIFRKQEDLRRAGLAGWIEAAGTESADYVQDRRWVSLLRGHDILPIRLPDVADPLQERAHELLTHHLGNILCGLCSTLRNDLDAFRYIGPLRDLPNRVEYALNQPVEWNAGDWATGRSAWLRILKEGKPLIDEINPWLIDPDKLNTGYKLELCCFKKIPDELAERMIKGIYNDERNFKEGGNETYLDYNDTTSWQTIQLEDSRTGVKLHPRDVGVGLTQIIPVVTATLDDQIPLLALEQPELHIHPKMQVRLADLLIHAYLDGDCDKPRIARQVIIETHSEHLLLRLLRRIRETSLGELPADIDPVSPDDCAIYYITPGEKGSVAQRLRIDTDGEFIDRWPDGFFEERDEELFG